MTWHALHYPLQTGSEETVKELFRESGRPDFDVRDAEGEIVGRLLGTLAFVGDRTAIRVMQVSGALQTIAAHLSRQTPIQEFERQLEDHLAVARDMRSPDGARQFFRHAGMRNVRADIDEHEVDLGWRGVFVPLESADDERVVKELTSLRTDDGVPTLAFVGEDKALVVRRASRDAAFIEEVRDAIGTHLADPEALEPVDLECVLVRRHDQPL